MVDKGRMWSRNQIESIAEDKAYMVAIREIRSHEKTSTAHNDKIGIILLLLMFITLGLALTNAYSIINKSRINATQLYEATGLQKICVEKTMTCEPCAIINYYNGEKFITDLDCPYPLCSNKCTRYAWMPPEETEREKITITTSNATKVDDAEFFFFTNAFEKGTSIQFVVFCHNNNHIIRKVDVIK